jgi:hypothetical protein
VPRFKQSAARRRQKRDSQNRRRRDPRARAAYNESQAQTMQRRRDATNAREIPPDLRGVTDSIVRPGPPLLLWMGKDGHLHRDDNRTAEEVIRDHERKKP